MNANNLKKKKEKTELRIRKKYICRSNFLDRCMLLIVSMYLKGGEVDWSIDQGL